LKVLKWSLGIAVVSASVFSYGANLLTNGKIKADVISGSLQYLGGITGIASLSENPRTKRESAVYVNSRTHVADQHGSSNGGHSGESVSVTIMQLGSSDNLYQPESVTWDHSSAQPISGYKNESSLGSVGALNKTDWLEFSNGSLGTEGGNRLLTAKTILPTDVTNVSPIPEPDTYLMMLAGFIMVGWIRYRQRSESMRIVFKE
jgi:hypothetical protein